VDLIESNTLNPNTYGSHQAKRTQYKYLWISPNKTHSIQTPADLTKQNALNPNTCGSHQIKHTQSKQHFSYIFLLAEESEENHQPDLSHLQTYLSSV
jgi:hypothetical protein